MSATILLKTFLGKTGNDIVIIIIIFAPRLKNDDYGWLLVGEGVPCG